MGDRDFREKFRKARQLLSGIATYVPGRARGLESRSPTGGSTDDPRYCYSVWLRHLVLAYRNGLCVAPPCVVAELGPGDSLGIGLAALLSGAESYFGLDVVHYSDVKRNLAVLDGLVSLFRERCRIPDAEFPETKPDLDCYAFPDDVLTSERLGKSLDRTRIERIRQSVARGTNHPGTMVRYAVPWFSSSIIDEASVDMIFSQAVLEHVDDLPATYRAMAAWLKPDGFLSHQIDFRSHGVASEWNGHWTFRDWQWRAVRGKRVYLINREPFSTHTTLLQDAGFEIVHVQKNEMASRLRPDELAPRFRHLSATDLSVAGAFILAKRAHQPRSRRD